MNEAKLLRIKTENVQYLIIESKEGRTTLGMICVSDYENRRWSIGQDVFIKGKRSIILDPNVSHGTADEAFIELVKLSAAYITGAL